MSITICFRTQKKFKQLLQELADKENRSVTSFIINALAVYIKDHHKIDWQELKKKPEKKV